jgi:hypothetical protein
MFVLFRTSHTNATFTGGFSFGILSTQPVLRHRTSLGVNGCRLTIPRNQSLRAGFLVGWQCFKIWYSCFNLCPIFSKKVLFYTQVFLWGQCRRPQGRFYFIFIFSSFPFWYLDEVGDMWYCSRTVVSTAIHKMSYFLVCDIVYERIPFY